MKIEASYTPERCQELYRSGLRAAAFGMESGSDRVLALIRKGCDRATLSAVNRSFHAAGIATEWMTFTDHPGETVDEAIETVKWIEAEKEHVDLFIVGEFGLEHGSDIASNPARYGIDAIYHAEGDELRFHPLYTGVAEKRTAADRERVDRLVRRLGSEYALRPYPWAGAVSTHHTFLHLLEFGPRAFRLHFQKAGAENEGALGTPAPSHIAGLRERPRFSLEAIERRTGEFLRRYLPEALRVQRDAAQDGEGRPTAPLSLQHFNAASGEVEPLRSGKDR
jgi:hypothetical protein